MAVVALLVLTVMAAEGGKAEKQGESWWLDDVKVLPAKKPQSPNAASLLTTLLVGRGS